MLSWQITTSPTDADAALIANGVVAYGRAQAVGGKAQPLACLVRDGAGNWSLGPPGGLNLRGCSWPTSGWPKTAAVRAWARWS